MQRVSLETDSFDFASGSLAQSHSLTPPLGGETETETPQMVGQKQNPRDKPGGKHIRLLRRRTGVQDYRCKVRVALEAFAPGEHKKESGG
jgi:hypothetical protein